MCVSVERQNDHITKSCSSILYSDIVLVVPNTAPHNVKVTRTSSNTANVTWTKLTLVESRGFITNYTISYSPLSMKREVNIFKKIENGNEEHSLLMDLEENSEYLLMMAASTRDGLGKYSNSILIAKNAQCKKINKDYYIILL